MAEIIGREEMKTPVLVHSDPNYSELSPSSMNIFAKYETILEVSVLGA
jgi:hypothetical protein